ncbi:MAG: SDR family oxidoreductase [Myxococcota bacterium]
MTSIDLRKKTALVTGVADNVGFAWSIAKSLADSGAEVILACHPRVVSIVQRFLQGEQYAESRLLPVAKTEFAPRIVIHCDVAYDTKADIPAPVMEQKGYRDCADPSIAGMVARLREAGLGENGRGVDIVVHAVAFSPEIKQSHLHVSRQGYLTAVNVSSYSLVGLCRALLPLMENRRAAVVALSYLAARRAVPHYGGGMASAKAALECDARMLAWELGKAGHRVNVVSAGTYPSRAARAIGDIEQMIEQAASRSPLRRPITAREVADSVLFLCSPLASGVTGEVLHVDAGYHAMGV